MIIVEKFNLKKNNFLLFDSQNFNRIIYFIKNMENFKFTAFYNFINFISMIYYSLIYENDEITTIFYLLKSFLFIKTNLDFIKLEKKSTMHNFFCKSEIFQIENLVKNVIFMFNNSCLFNKKIKIPKANEYPLENLFSEVKSLKMNNGNLYLKDIIECFSQINNISQIKKSFNNQKPVISEIQFCFVNEKDLNSLYLKAIKELIFETKINNTKLKKIRIEYLNNFLKKNPNFEE
jgi:hypothetical protein